MNRVNGGGGTAAGSAGKTARQLVEGWIFLRPCVSVASLLLLVLLCRSSQSKGRVTTGLNEAPSAVGHATAFLVAVCLSRHPVRTEQIVHVSSTPRRMTTDTK